MAISSAAAAAATTFGAGQTKSDQNQAKLEDDLNKFLNLLVTQLKNQDPLEPMDATEFTNQLVQFASVEQQIYQNSNLEKLLHASHVDQVSNLASYLGTTVEGNGGHFTLDNSAAKFSYTLYGHASTNTMIVTDDTGKSVFSTQGKLTEGRHEYVWDGKDELGNQLPDGTYTFTIAAQDREGLPVDFSQTVFGKVTSAGADAGEVSLNMGNVSIPLDKIISVSETPTAPAPPVP